MKRRHSTDTDPKDSSRATAVDQGANNNVGTWTAQDSAPTWRKLWGTARELSFRRLFKRPKLLSRDSSFDQDRSDTRLQSPSTSLQLQVHGNQESSAGQVQLNHRNSPILQSEAESSHKSSTVSIELADLGRSSSSDSSQKHRNPLRRTFSAFSSTSMIVARLRKNRPPTTTSHNGALTKATSKTTKSQTNGSIFQAHRSKSSNGKSTRPVSNNSRTSSTDTASTSEMPPPTGNRFTRPDGKTVKLNMAIGRLMGPAMVLGHIGHIGPVKSKHALALTRSWLIMKRNRTQLIVTAARIFTNFAHENRCVDAALGVHKSLIDNPQNPQMDSIFDHAKFLISFIDDLILNINRSSVFIEPIENFGRKHAYLADLCGIREQVWEQIFLMCAETFHREFSVIRTTKDASEAWRLLMAVISDHMCHGFQLEIKARRRRRQQKLTAVVDSSVNTLSVKSEQTHQAVCESAGVASTSHITQTPMGRCPSTYRKFQSTYSKPVRDPCCSQSTNGHPATTVPSSTPSDQSQSMCHGRKLRSSASLPQNIIQEDDNEVGDELSQSGDSPTQGTSAFGPLRPVDLVLDRLSLSDNQLDTNMLTDNGVDTAVDGAMSDGSLYSQGSGTYLQRNARGPRDRHGYPGVMPRSRTVCVDRLTDCDWYW